MRLMFRFAVLIAAATAVLEMPATAQLALSGTYDVTLSAGEVKIPVAAQIPPDAMTPKPFTAVK